MNELLIFVSLASLAIIFSSGLIVGIILQQRYGDRDKKITEKRMVAPTSTSPGKTVYLTPAHEDSIRTKANKQLVPEDDGW